MFLSPPAPVLLRQVDSTVFFSPDYGLPPQKPQNAWQAFTGAANALTTSQDAATRNEASARIYNLLTGQGDMRNYAPDNLYNALSLYVLLHTISTPLFLTASERSYTHTHTHMHTHTHTHFHTHTHTHFHTHTHTHADAHAHAHTLTHTHTKIRPTKTDLLLLFDQSICRYQNYVLGYGG